MKSQQFDFSNLIEELKEKYFNQFEDEVSEDPEEFKALASIKIINSTVTIIKFYIGLLLSGEYCKISSDSLKTDNDELIDYLEGISQSNQFDINKSTSNEILEFFLNNSLNALKTYIIPATNYLARDLKSQFQLGSAKKLLRAEKKKEVIRIDEKIDQYVRAFNILIFLIRSEHFDYRLENSIIKRFLIVDKEIENLSSIEAEIKNSISIKCKFLLKKLLYRTKLGSSADNEWLYSFDHNNEDEYLNIDKFPLKDGFSDWEQIINSHYGIDSHFKRTQRKRAESLHKKASESNYMTFSEFHALTKIYKDDSKNVEKLENLKTLFLNSSLDEQEFEVYAWKVSGSYLFNNWVSLSCESRGVGEEFFQNLYKEIRNHQNEYSFKNYFPWMKLASSLCGEIDKISNNLIDVKDQKLFNNYLILFNSVLKKLDKAYEWSLYKNYIPYQLSFDECKSPYVVNFDGNKAPFKLFFFSSYILPLDYKQVKKEVEELHNTKTKFETLLSLYRKIQFVVEDVTESSNRMRNHERRSVEILAVFSAIALFTIGSIQIFSSDIVKTDPLLPYKFIISFGYTLALFVLLIWLITRDGHSSKMNRTQRYLILFFVISGTIIVLSFLFTLGNSPNILQEESRKYMPVIMRLFNF